MKWSTPISWIIWNEPGSNESVAPESWASAGRHAAPTSRGGSVKNDHAVRCRCVEWAITSRGSSLGSR